MRHTTSFIKGLVLAIGKTGKVAEVGHKGVAAPAQEPLNVERREAHGMEEDTSANPKGVRAPFLELLLVLDGVEIIDSHSKGPHKFLDLGCSDEPNRLGEGIPITRQRGGLVESRVHFLESLETLDNPVHGGNKAIGIRIVRGVRNHRATCKHAFFTMVAILLGTEDDPALADRLQRGVKDGKADISLVIDSFHSDIIEA